MTTGRHFENWSMAVSTKSWLIIADDVNYGVVHFRLLCKEYLTLFKKLSLVVFCCKFWTLEQKLHDYICSGCKNMVSQKCAVFIGPPCTMLTNPHWVSVIEATSIVNCMTIHCVQKKNTHSHFLSYLHEGCVNLNKNCGEYTQGKVDSENV